MLGKWQSQDPRLWLADTSCGLPSPLSPFPTDKEERSVNKGDGHTTPATEGTTEQALPVQDGLLDQVDLVLNSVLCVPECVYCTVRPDSQFPSL